MNIYDTEILFLKHIITSLELLNKAKSYGIKEDHIFGEPDSKTNYSKIIYKLINQYYDESESLFTDYVLNSKLEKTNIKQNHKANILLLWDDIKNARYNENDFIEIVKNLKTHKALKLISEQSSATSGDLVNYNVEKWLQNSHEYYELIRKEISFEELQNNSIDITQEGAEYFDKTYKNKEADPEKFSGVSFGIKEIDEITGGVQKGEVACFFGPSAGGKSVQLLNAGEANREQKKNVLYVSTELNKEVCVFRHVSLITAFPFSLFRKISLTNEQFNECVNKLKQLGDEENYFIYETPSEDKTPEYIEAKLIELKNKRTLPDVLIVDYLGEMTIRNANPNLKEWEIESQALEKLWVIAQKYNIPVITACQFNNETMVALKTARSNGKAFIFDQTIGAGAKKIYHRLSWGIAMEPDYDTSRFIYYPAKTRYGKKFAPVVAQLHSESNKILPISQEDQEVYLELRGLLPKISKPPKPTQNEDQKIIQNIKNNNDTFSDDEEIDINEELDMSDWDVPI